MFKKIVAGITLSALLISGIVPGFEGAGTTVKAAVSRESLLQSFKTVELGTDGYITLGEYIGLDREMYIYSSYDMDNGTTYKTRIKNETFNNPSGGQNLSGLYFVEVRPGEKVSYESGADLSRAFYNLTNLEYLDLYYLDVQWPTNTQSMFENDYKLTTTGLTFPAGFTLRYATSNISRMFANCRSLEKLDLSKETGIGLPESSLQYTDFFMGMNNLSEIIVPEGNKLPIPLGKTFYQGSKTVSTLPTDSEAQGISWTLFSTDIPSPTPGGSITINQTSVSIANNLANVYVSWTPIATSGSYTIQYRTPNTDSAYTYTQTVPGNGTQSNFTIAGLTPNSYYGIRVYAQNSEGVNVSSNWTTVSTYPGDSTFRNYRAVPNGQNAINVSWDYNSDVASYTVCFRTAADPAGVYRTIYLDGSSTGTTITSLSPGSTYTVWVEAQLRDGSVRRSADIAVTTPGGSSGPTDLIKNTLPRVYRVYNKTNGEHFFTTKVNEVQSLVRRGWEYEGIAWNAPKRADASTTVYRMYNPVDNYHFYTANLTERNTLVNLGWEYEGRAWYSGNQNYGNAVYRLYNPKAPTPAGTHHYTISRRESRILVDRGWVYEGIAWYTYD